MNLTAPMNPEIKKLWVDALRSGEFEQGHGALNINGKFCCLGVLCELAVRAGQPVKVQQAVDADPGVVAYDGQSGTLPDSVMGWAGLADTNPTVQVSEDHTCDILGCDCRRTYESLAGLNDDGIPFNEIADRIDANL